MSRSRLRSISSASPGSWKGSASRVQALDPLGDDVADDDLVPALGEAGARDEADPAGAEDAKRGFRGQLYFDMGRRPLAISSIVSFESLSSSVFTTQ